MTTPPPDPERRERAIELVDEWIVMNSMDITQRAMADLDDRVSMLAAQEAQRATEAELEKLWAAQVNADESMNVASEAWARCAELVEMLEGRKAIDHEMIAKLKEHRAHVVTCQKGSCEHEYAALVRAGLVHPLTPVSEQE